jgi:hypothetical protein
MAAKKKTTTKSENDGKGTKAQVAAFKTTKSSVKPTAAFTNKGQKPKGLTPRTPAPAGKTTPIRKATDAFAGSGMPLGTSFGINPMNKGQIIGALSTAAGAGSLGRSVAKKVASKKAVDKMIEGFRKEIQKGIQKGSKSDNLLPGNSGPRWNHE